MKTALREVINALSKQCITYAYGNRGWRVYSGIRRYTPSMVNRNGLTALRP